VHWIRRDASDKMPVPSCAESMHHLVESRIFGKKRSAEI
jgi:hypothetical protein